ncbi:ATP-binding cassette domain-containing protein [Paenibacillus terricola]|uniref:ATP-binding cassette domain-containing protein n=1 Tax=Paenibacillus terricola TaxID=2763503 RepID=UPI002963D678|nr:ATP-binding cassette domain-containing protein [Paenibacillus terricola]
MEYRKSEPEGGIRIDIQGASVQFGELTVLQRLNLSIPSGQFLGVVGRSGCGKSTLLRIAGLEAASHGSVRFDGEPTGTCRIGRLFYLTLHDVRN